MITKREILEQATYANLQPHVAEKDYVLGWLLAGINQHPALSKAWVFKGGTCLKKCYFETYRFSEDLDFTLLDAAHLDHDFLQTTFTDIGTWIYENSGIEIYADRLVFDIYENPRGVKSCQGRIYYRGPVTAAGKQSIPKIKIDLTPDEILVDKPVLTPVRHDYSDNPGGINIQSYSYVEVFAEKIRALKERTRPRDLYDVINFFRRPESHTIAGQVREMLEQKCRYKNINFPQPSDLEAHKDACASGWREQLAHQLPALPPFDSFWEELTTFFDWLEHPEKIVPTLPKPIPLALGEVSNVNIWRMGGSTNMLDLIRFATANHLCLELYYREENGEQKTYLIEPYSLRTTADKNLLLYGVKLPIGETIGFRTDRMLKASVTEQSFEPRYMIEFIPQGPA